MPKSEVYYSDGIRTRTLHYDPRDGWDGDFTIETVQDCTSIVENNRALEEQQKGRDMKLVARFPVTFAEQAMKEGRWDDEDYWKKLLNDPDLRDFRVWQGRL